MSPTGREKVLQTTLTVRLSKALRKKLEALAAKDRRDLSEYVRLVLEDHAGTKRAG